MDLTKATDAEINVEMNKRFIIPNFYKPFHFYEMKDWNEEKIERFKKFMCWSMENDTTISQLMRELLCEFENEWDEEEEEEEEDNAVLSK